jgi:PAS domain S-box-containing protein
MIVSREISMHKFAKNEMSVLRTLVDNLPVGILLKDVNDNFKIKLCNNAAEKIFGFDRDNVINKTIFDFWPDHDVKSMFSNDTKVVSSNQITYFNEENFPTPNGIIHLKTKKIPLCFTSKDHVDYLLCVYEDITDFKKSRDEKNKLVMQLEEAQEIAKIGSWNFNLHTHELSWSKEHYRIFEIEHPQTQENLYRMYREKIHHDDIHRLDYVLETALINGNDFIYDHRIICGDGRIKYVQGIGKVSSYLDGKPLIVSGTCQDQTVQREAEFRLDQLSNSIEEVFWISNAEKSKMLFINSAFEKIWGIPLREITENPHNFTNSIHPEDRQRVIEALPKQQNGTFNETYRIVRPDGGIKWIRDRA